MTSLTEARIGPVLHPETVSQWLPGLTLQTVDVTEIPRAEQRHNDVAIVSFNPVLTTEGDDNAQEAHQEKDWRQCLLYERHVVLVVEALVVVPAPVRVALLTNEARFVVVHGDSLHAHAHTMFLREVVELSEVCQMLRCYNPCQTQKGSSLCGH